MAEQQLRLKLAAAVHQTVEIDRHDLVPAFTLKLAAAIDHRALRQDQNVERVERQGGCLNGVWITDIDAIIAEPG